MENINTNRAVVSRLCLEVSRRAKEQKAEVKREKR
jgi:hypothetical protein